MSKKHELELVSRLGFGLEEHMGVHVICEEDETTEADLCHRVLWGEAMRLLAQRDKLLAALERTTEMCEQYADWINRNVMSADIEQHPYLPELEGAAEDARAAIAEVKGGV